MERLSGWRTLTTAAAAMAASAACLGCEIRIDDRSTREANLEAAAREAILEELRGYYRDFSALDSAAFADRFWPGADVTTAWQPPGETGVRVVVTPVTAFITQWPQGPGSQPVFQEWMVSADVRLHGDLAQVWARYGARFGDSTAVREWQGIDAFTLMRAGGRWRIVELAFAGDGAGED